MRNGNVRIPRDIETYIAKKRTVRVVALLLIEVLLLTFTVLFQNDINSGAYPTATYTLLALLMIAPVFWLKIPFWLFDKTWAGEIISKSEDVYIGPDENRRVTTGSLQIKKQQRLNIRLDSGKTIEYTIYDNRARHAFRNSTYNVGDRVIHVGGTNYLQAVAVGDGDTLICVICGAESRADTPVCHICGKTLKID